MAKVTPMMEQYLAIKNEYNHCLLLYRLGDFYELFFEDALIASRELEITLTGREWGQEERAPMCGVPYHSADAYIAKLVQKGYHIAICEQMEDPKQTRGLVKREVVRVITPGTVLDQRMLDETKNNYLLCILAEKLGFGLAAADVSTGEFLTTELVKADASVRLLDEIARYSPAQILCNTAFSKQPIAAELEKRYHLQLEICDDWRFSVEAALKNLCAHFKVQTLDGFGLRQKPLAQAAAGCLLQYLTETQKNELHHISGLRFYATSAFMLLDSATRRNLELTETMREKERKGTLLWVLDRTKTAMGARLLRKWVEQPLVQSEAIRYRLDAVEELYQDVFLREELKDALAAMYDFERIMGRVIYQSANARDLYSLKQSIARLPLLKELLRKCKSPYLCALFTELDALENIHTLIEKSIVEEPPFSVREGGMIREGFRKDLDILFRAKVEGKQWIDELEEEERSKTGIKNLKIRFNRVFGYYIEVTKSNLSEVPDRYLRKQTLANCERYITPQLSELAELILGAEEKIVDLEYTVFTEIRDAIAAEVERIQGSARVTATVDVLQSLAEVAQAFAYVKPIVDDSGIIDIQKGRHPVVERMLEDPFIPNDTFLDLEESRLSIITGPNMAGKSTYMRQTALIVLLAQIGSFVPAEHARIGVTDRVFTRVGASDDLAAGQSTFMVEMTEVAGILHGATKHSLLILDEIGRGTSTFDGLSIAWAVLELIADKKVLGAKTLFSTHYHELTELEGNLPGVKNYCVAVKEDGEDILFLRTIIRGGSDHSYGIQVARLAGLPHHVINRSQQILKKLNATDVIKKNKKIAHETKEAMTETAKQIGLFSIQETQLADAINKLDVMSMTPIEALQTLLELQQKAKGL